MTPLQIAALVTVLAAVVVVVTRLRLARGDALAAAVPRWVRHAHTLCGLAALGCWVVALLIRDETLAWVALPLWWLTALAGLAVMLLWMPPRGRHADEGTPAAWGEGTGLSILAHGGLTAGVSLFTLFLVAGLLPAP